MTQPVSPESLAEYEGKKVTLTVADPDAEGGQRTIEGKAEKSNPMGVLIKPKGKTGLELFTADKVLDIEAAPEKPKEIKAKKLKPIEGQNVKQHLVDRHGYGLKAINAYSDEEAASFHDGLDHTELDLGHVHVAEEAKAEGEAAEESAA